MTPALQQSAFALAGDQGVDILLAGHRGEGDIVFGGDQPGDGHQAVGQGLLVVVELAEAGLPGPVGAIDCFGLVEHAQQVVAGLADEIAAKLADLLQLTVAFRAEAGDINDILVLEYPASRAVAVARPLLAPAT